MLQFPFTRMPYRYELAQVSCGETTLAMRLCANLLPRDLVLLDAGFWSYGLLWTIQNQKAFFALRLKSGVKLTTLKRLGSSERLVRWTPKDSRGNWRKAGLPTSIDLRVIDYRVPGFRRQAIVTNVLSQKAISRADWTRLTTNCQDAHCKLLPGLFHRRWEIETSFSEMKVVQGMEGRLRSHVPESIAYEIAGHVVLYLLVRWLMVEAAVKHGLDPLRLSFLEAFRELQDMRQSLLTATLPWASRVLLPRLLDRIAEHRVPERPGRHYPRRKKSKTSDTKKQSPKKRAKHKASHAKSKSHKRCAKQG
jgi:DDE family transposase